MANLPKATANSTNSAVLDLLRATYKTLFIPAVAAGREIGLADKTTRNMLSEKRFPLETTTVGVKRVVSIFVLADYVERKSPSLLSPPNNVASKSAKRGPRFKKDRLAEQGRA